MQFPIMSKGITLNEIPNKIAIYLEFGNCRQKCKGCHSPHLFHRPAHYTTLDEILTYVTDQKEKGANAVVLMGGTHNKNVTFNMMKHLIKQLSQILPVGLYSGLPVRATIHQQYKQMIELTYLKVGDYQAQNGGLDKPSTNQRFYARSPLLGRWRDCTYIFQQQKEKPNDTKQN